MSETALESVIRRDRAVVLAALLAVAALAWGYVVWLAVAMYMDSPAVGEMPGMSMPASDMGPMMHASVRPWSVPDFLFMFFMWAVMMVGMMLPSAAPMVLIYARVARHALAKKQPFAATAWFAGGYLVAWTAFALGATAAQWALESTLLLTPGMAATSDVFGGLVLIGAGLYQWTPLKESCLSQCQTPFTFIQRHGGFRREPTSAMTQGAQHGLYCIGCCWALMTLLFVGGVMNLLWVAGIAIYVLFEKIVPVGWLLPRLAGTVLVGAGTLLLITGSFV